MAEENKFSSKLSKQLLLGGAMLFNVTGSPYQKRGWPDIQVYCPIWSGHLELKGQRTPLGTMQKIILRRLRRVGVAAYILRVHGDDLRLQNYESEVVATFKGWATLKGSKGDRGRAVLKWLRTNADATREKDDGKPDGSFH